MNILPPTSHLVDVIGHVENTMLATFGGQLSQHQLFGRIKGFSSSGTNIMVMYALLRLAKPIQVEQAGSLEPYMCVREDERCAELVGKMKEDTFFGDDAAVTSAKELAKQSKAEQIETKRGKSSQAKAERAKAKSSAKQAKANKVKVKELCWLRMLSL